MRLKWGSTPGFNHASTRRHSRAGGIFRDETGAKARAAGVGYGKASLAAAGGIDRHIGETAINATHRIKISERYLVRADYRRDGDTQNQQVTQQFSITGHLGLNAPG